MTTNLPFTCLKTLLIQDQHVPFSFVANSTISRADLLAHAVQISKQLPAKSYAINLCQDRYLFTVTFLAAIIKNQVTLLPSNKSPDAVKKLLDNYTNSYNIIDNPKNDDAAHFLIESAMLDNCSEPFPNIDNNQTVAISFTSGSTGIPKASQKTWQEFKQAALLAIKQLRLQEQRLNIISTVPPQHMYGLETSIFWPLFSSTCISGSRPFFPEDIRKACHASPIPCLLITTPTHLQACVQAGIEWQNVGMILSSTAPLPKTLAQRAEQLFNAPLLEIFGSTETMSFASRRLSKEKKWAPYQGIELYSENATTMIKGGHLPETLALDDQFKIDADGCFTVLGRSADLIKIAGKRASLSELNLIINNIAGVDEGIFFTTDTERLGALVVTHLSKAEILRRLRHSIDEVFLPRPLKIVALLPRNEVGKIIKTKLDHIIKELQIA